MPDLRISRTPLGSTLQRGVEGLNVAIETVGGETLPHNLTWVDMPDLRRVFTYGAVRRKLPGPSHVQDSLPHPSPAVAVCRVHPVLCLDVGSKIGQKHITVSLGQ